MRVLTSTDGVHGSGNKLQLDVVTQGPYSKNIGSRTFLMKDDYAYQLFQLKNKEFTYTVDDSQLDCGLNGALYFVQMDADGGKSKYGKAGAELGLGYCDAQCPHDLKFINNEANVEGWKPSDTDPNARTGKHGSCCTEIDIWEANKMASANTMHACSPGDQTRCLLASSIAIAAGQQAGTLQAENHPQLSWSECTAPGQCQTQAGKVVIDANWRWTHKTGETTNCYTDNEWDAQLCPDKETCTRNCVVEGADAEYEATDGVHASGSERARVRQRVAVGFPSNEFRITILKPWRNRVKS